MMLPLMKYDQIRQLNQEESVEQLNELVKALETIQTEAMGPTALPHGS